MANSGVNGIVRPVATTYVGVNGAVRAVNRTYVGVDNAVRTVNRTHVGVYTPIAEIEVELNACYAITNVQSGTSYTQTAIYFSATAKEYANYALSSNGKTFSVTSNISQKGLMFLGPVMAICPDGTRTVVNNVQDVSSFSMTVSHSLSGPSSRWQATYWSTFLGENIWETSKTITFTAVPTDAAVTAGCALQYGGYAVSTITLGQAIVNGLSVPIKFVLKNF